MYSYEIILYLQKILNKLSKKDKQLYERILNKIEEIINCENVEHYKNLRYDMNDRKSVHIGHFVLVFKFIKEESKIKFVDFDHHNKIYMWGVIYFKKYWTKGLYTHQNS